MTTELKEKELELNNEKAEISEQENNLLRLEREAREFFIVKDATKEASELNKERKEHIMELYNTLDIPRLIIKTEDNEWIVVEEKVTQKDVLDIEALLLAANKDLGPKDIMLDKDELKTPWDYAKLAEKGRITAEMIAKCTYLDTQKKVQIRKTKRKPKEIKK